LQACEAASTPEKAHYPTLKLGRQEPQVKFSGAPFTLVNRADIGEIDKDRRVEI
jgi:hypothetical protein